MVKASEGGGGKGIRKVHKQEDLEAAYRQVIGLTVILEMVVFFFKSFLSSVVFRCSYFRTREFEIYLTATLLSIHLHFHFDNTFGLLYKF